MQIIHVWPFAKRYFFSPICLTANTLLRILSKHLVFYEIWASWKMFLESTGWTKSTLPILNQKYFWRLFDFFQKYFAIRTSKGLQIICFKKNFFKIIPGLSRVQNSEVAKSSPRATCKIANNFEKYFQQMALMV